MLSTDASLLGWGATWKNLMIQGRWSQEESDLHISILETEAVFRAISHWDPDLRGHKVTILSDNTSTVAYINHQGGTRSGALLSRTWKLLTRCEELEINLRATHLAGKENTVADALSRGRFSNTEWCLSQQWADLIFSMYGRPSVDLFASASNARLPTFCSWTFHPHAWRLDAFSFQWTGFYLYAFPPWNLLHRVLSTLRSADSEMLLIAPFRPNQPWLPLWLRLLVDQPFLFLITKYLLAQRGGSIWHRELDLLHLSVGRYQAALPGRGTSTGSC